MANYLSYSNVQVLNVNTLVTTLSKIRVGISTKATAAYNKYKNYSQSNIFQVGTWTTGGTAGTTVMQFNDNWNTVCSDFGINPSVLTMLLYSTTSSPPTTAQKTDFLDNMRYYFPHVVDCLNNTVTRLKYNNLYYELYAMFEGNVSSFRRQGFIPVYDPVENHWYIVSFQYRTDNFNPGKVWLTVDNAPSVQSNFFPTSGVPIASTSNPYPNVEDSDTGGGEGDAGGTSDTIPVPSLPSISALGTGLVQLYNPTAGQLSSFGAWLWNSDGLSLDDLKRVMNDPMDMILGLSIFPVAVPTSTDDYIKMGNITSTVQAAKASAQYTRKDMGTLDILKYYNSYLDYSPYTKIQIFLPYIGIRTLNTDEVMGKTLGLKYSIDLLSGACIAHITVNGSLMYEYGGTCNSEVPLTGRDMTNVFQSIAGIVSAGALVIGGFAAGGAGAGAGAAAGATATGAFNASAIASGVIGGARSALGMKPTVEHASGIGGTTGYMSSQTPYLIIERPRLCHPENQEHFTGYPGFIYRRVGDCEGFTKFVNVELTNIHATKEELEELENWFVNRGVRL